MCYECKEPGHYKNECPKLQKDRPKRSGDRKKKVLMETWDDSECSDSDSDSDSEHANMALMANTDSEDEVSVSGSDTETEEVFSDISREELSESLSEMFENYNSLKLRYKQLKSKLESESDILRKEIVELKENNLKLENDLKVSQQSTAQKSGSSVKNILEEYDYSFQEFLKKSLNRSVMASMIYGVSRNNRKGIGFIPTSEKREPPVSVDDMVIKYTPLYDKFKYGHSHDIKYTSSVNKFKDPIKPKFPVNLRKTNPKGPKKMWVPKDKIFYVADVLSSKVQTPIMVPGLWVLSTHDGKKVYVPKPGT